MTPTRTSARADIDRAMDSTASVVDSAPLSARSRAKQSAILEAARDAFLEHGFESVSMDEVASDAGVGKATIYAHFGSKVDLFRAIVEITAGEIVEIEAQAPKFDKPVDDWLPAFAVTYARKLYDPRLLALLRLAIGGSKDTRSAGPQYLRSGPELGRQNLAAIFHEVHTRGLLKIDDVLLAVDQFSNLIVPERFYALLDPARIPRRAEIDRQARDGALRFIAAYRP